MLAGALKATIDFTLSRIPQPGRDHRLVVLCYHSVHPDAEFPARTAPDVFEQQLEWLRRNCRLVRFTDVWRESMETRPSRPTVAITFDDGHADNHTTALPLLLRHEVPATFFVATGLVDRVPSVIAARSWKGWRDPSSTLTWDQVRDIRRRGMDIGSHGHTHTPLAQMQEGDAFLDLSLSKQKLEDQLGERVVAVAYPKGRPRRDIVTASMELATKAGFEHGAAILLRGVERADGPMMIPRFPIGADGSNLFRAKVAGRLDLIGALQERAPLSLLRALGGRSRHTAR